MPRPFGPQRVVHRHGLAGPLLEAPEPARVKVMRVTSNPGARTAWHTHFLGQMLHVLSGALGVVRYNTCDGREHVEAQERGGPSFRWHAQHRSNGALPTTQLERAGHSIT